MASQVSEANNGALCDGELGRSPCSVRCSAQGMSNPTASADVYNARIFTNTSVNRHRK